MIQPPTHQIPGVYHRRIGDIVVTALSDGYLDGTVDVLQNIAPDEAMRVLTDSFRPGRRTSVNCYAIFSAGRLALIETGSGDYLLPTAGKLQKNLAAAGIDPVDIEKVILTHMHPDHSAGLTDPKTGTKLFPNAELVVHENEPRHWHDDTAMGHASDRAKKLYFQCAREQMAPYHNVTHTFSGATEVFPGVTSVPLHGHTPGHSGYMISSGKDTLLIWGDIVHVPDIQIPRPEVTIEFDTDPHAAAATRKRVLDMVATDRQLVAGMHMHFPGFAHVVFRIRSLIVAERKAEQGTAPVYMYSFEWETPVQGGRLKAPHALDVPFTFDTIDLTNATDRSPAAHTLASTMSGTWAAFAHSGVPVYPSIPRWPTYDQQTRSTMMLDAECHIENDPLGETRQLWQEITAR